MQITTKIYRTYLGVHSHTGDVGLIDLQDGLGADVSPTTVLAKWVTSAWVEATHVEIGVTKVMTKLTRSDNHQFVLIDAKIYEFFSGGTFHAPSKKLRVAAFDGGFFQQPVNNAKITIDEVEYPLGDIEDCAALEAAWNESDVAGVLGHVACDGENAILYPFPGVVLKTIPFIIAELPS